MLRTQSLRGALEQLEKKTRFWQGLFLLLFAISVGGIHFQDFNESWIAIPGLELIFSILFVMARKPWAGDLNPSMPLLIGAAACSLLMVALLFLGIRNGGQLGQLAYWVPCLVIWGYLFFPADWANRISLLSLVILLPALISMDLAERGAVISMVLIAVSMAMTLAFIEHQAVSMKDCSGLDFHSTALTHWQFEKDLQREIARIERQDSVLGIVVVRFKQPRGSGRMFQGNPVRKLCICLIDRLPALYSVYLLNNKSVAVMMPMFRLSDRSGVEQLLQESGLAADLFETFWFEFVAGDDLASVLNQVVAPQDSSGDIHDF